MVPVPKMPSPAHSSGINCNPMSLKIFLLTQSVASLAFTFISCNRLHLFYVNALHSLLDCNILRLEITLFINKPQ